jgi:hypothetical protein
LVSKLFFEIKITGVYPIFLECMIKRDLKI